MYFMDIIYPDISSFIFCTGAFKYWRCTWQYYWTSSFLDSLLGDPKLINYQANLTHCVLLTPYLFFPFMFIDIPLYLLLFCFSVFLEDFFNLLLILFKFFENTQSRQEKMTLNKVNNNHENSKKILKMTVLHCKNYNLIAEFNQDLAKIKFFCTKMS